MPLVVEKIVVGPFQENTYLVFDSEKQDAILIDPGAESQRIKQELTQRRLNLLAILNTHAHIDHVGAVADLQKEFDAPFYLHEKERRILNQLNDHSVMFGLPTIQEPKVTKWITTEEDLKIGLFSVNVLHTPGHTPGGVCYLVDGHGFVGDTLFKGSVGRTDLPGGSWETLERSLRRLIKDIPKDLTLHSGHGVDTTLSEEFEHNPFLYPLVS